MAPELRTDRCVRPSVLVDDDYMLDDTITLTPMPGRSPCHCCVKISSGGRRASVTGDSMYHALECLEPNSCTVFDRDAEEGIASRRRFLRSVADTDTLILPIPKSSTLWSTNRLNTLDNLRRRDGLALHVWRS